MWVKLINECRALNWTCCFPTLVGLRVTWQCQSPGIHFYFTSIWSNSFFVLHIWYVNDKLFLLFNSSDGGIYTDTVEDKLSHIRPDAKGNRTQGKTKHDKIRSHNQVGYNDTTTRNILLVWITQNPEGKWASSWSSWAYYWLAPHCCCCPALYCYQHPPWKNNLVRKVV